jgi:hypothetical protein
MQSTLEVSHSCGAKSKRLVDMLYPFKTGRGKCVNLPLWWVSAWIEKPFENWPIFMKIEEIGLDWFHRFSVNRQSNLNCLKI